MLALEGRIRRGSFALDATLAVEPGARVALIGPSGGGKSTLLEAIAGFLPVEGRLEWEGRALDGAPGARPVSMLFQEENLFPHLTVAQNAGLGLRPDLRLSKGERARVGAALDRVGLGGMAARRPAQLSGGQRGRAALARILLMRRPLVLLDEPFAALGPALKVEMLALVAQVIDAVGGTLLMVTHDIEEARAIAGAAIVVAEGRAGPPKALTELLDRPPPALRRYLGA